MVGVEYNMNIRDLEPLMEGHWLNGCVRSIFFSGSRIAHYLDESYARLRVYEEATQQLESYQLVHHWHPGKTHHTCLTQELDEICPPLRHGSC